nr:P-loop NTPase [uncultured Dysosmobacter sp.]
MIAAANCSHRISIITGHYGTGKTEFAVNLALALAETGRQVMLADLDIVNPYFRSRERRQLLEESGVRLISSSQACSDADVPALPAELLTILENREIQGVLDIGGDPVGARVLARFQPKIVREDYQLIYVLNANRPEVRSTEKAIAYLRGIEATTGLACTGIVNNTHLCGETTEAEIRKGAALAAAVSEEAGIPVLCHVAEERFAAKLSDLPETVFPITIRMKKPWE